MTPVLLYFLIRMKNCFYFWLSSWVSFILSLQIWMCPAPENYFLMNCIIRLYESINNFFMQVILNLNQDGTLVMLVNMVTYISWKLTNLSVSNFVQTICHFWQMNDANDFERIFLLIHLGKVYFGFSSYVSDVPKLKVIVGELLISFLYYAPGIFADTFIIISSKRWTQWWKFFSLQFENRY